MEFNLVDLQITVESRDPVGLALRLAEAAGAFAAACRRTVCVTPTAGCAHCPSSERCAWQTVFSQQLSTDPAALKRHQKPPLPFVFSFPFAEEAGEGGGMVECGLVVAGRAIPHLEMLLKGFEELVADDSRQPGRIVQVAARDYHGECRLLGNVASAARAENLPVLSAAAMLEASPWECAGVTIRLLSPLRLLQGGRPCRRFDFSLFARSLMRRVSSFAYYYGECELETDFRQLSSLAGRVGCIEDRFRHGSMENCKQRTEGITGSGAFVGELGDLMPFLILGTYLHVGKGAAFGMGRYALILNT